MIYQKLIQSPSKSINDELRLKYNILIFSQIFLIELS